MVLGELDGGEGPQVEAEQVGGIAGGEVQVGVAGGVLEVGFVIVGGDVLALTIALPVIEPAGEGRVVHETGRLGRRNELRGAAQQGAGDGQPQRIAPLAMKSHRNFLVVWEMRARDAEAPDAT